MAAAFQRISRLFGGRRGGTLCVAASTNSLLRPQVSILPALLVPSKGIVFKLFVGGISYYTTEKTLSDAFTQYGQVIEAKIVTERNSDRSKGFGFVTYASEDEALTAIEEMNGKELNGRAIFVNFARANQGDRGGPFLVARGPPQGCVENGKHTGTGKPDTDRHG